MDEFAVRQLLSLDAVHALERGSDKERPLPSPSMGWMGSHLSLTFLSSNANSSSELGCGAFESGILSVASRIDHARGI
jgi:hypothetical protein